MFYLFYNFISVFLLVPVCLFTVYRSVRLNWPLALAPRFGLIPAAELAKIRGRQVILLHAVSVGEVFAARTLVKTLRTRYPDHALVVSTGTETGRQTALALPEVDLCIYFPFDFLPSVRLMLIQLQPCIVIVMETEIWPNFTREIARRKVPLVMANGRISDRSYGRYLKLGWFFRHALQNFTLLCMQSETVKERIINIGAPPGRVVVAGNLKFDLALRLVTANEKAELRRHYNIPVESLVIVAGSTHSGEEEMLLEIYRELQAEFGNFFLVLAPRHPQRSREVSELLEKSGVSFRRFTEQKNTGMVELRSGELLLVDTVGELMNLYCLADVGFVGGSMVPKGGHNLLEPASCGLPVVFGPYMANFRDIASLVIDSQAGIQVGSKAELTAALRLMLVDQDKRCKLGSNGREMIRLHGGSTQKHLEQLSSLMAH